jgi:hypothetical protein
VQEAPGLADPIDRLPHQYILKVALRLEARHYYPDSYRLIDKETGQTRIKKPATSRREKLRVFQQRFIAAFSFGAQAQPLRLSLSE